MLKIVPCALSGSQLTSFFSDISGGGGGRERNEEGSIKGSGVGNRKSIVPLPLKGMRIILCIVYQRKAGIYVGSQWTLEGLSV